MHRLPDGAPCHLHAHIQRSVSGAWHVQLKQLLAHAPTCAPSSAP